MAITVTKSAAQQIAKQLDKRGHGIGLRLGVKESGCSGYSYQLDYADSQDANDLIFNQFGVKVLIAPQHLNKLDGVELDWAKEGINESFKFRNPNSSGECGCGSSFSL